jgi:hypothetical protein
MVIKKKQAKLPPNPYRTTASPDDLGPTDRIAFDIVAERRDLLPSVERIMNAGLDADAALRAMTLFGDSLHRAGDPHRDPRVAIANSVAAPPGPSPAPRRA